MHKGTHKKFNVGPLTENWKNNLAEKEHMALTHKDGADVTIQLHFVGNCSVLTKTVPERQI